MPTLNLKQVNDTVKVYVNGHRVETIEQKHSGACYDVRVFMHIYEEEEFPVRINNGRVVKDNKEILEYLSYDFNDAVLAFVEEKLNTLRS